MTEKRFKKKTTQNKNKRIFKRLRHCADAQMHKADLQCNSPKVQLTQKDVTNILLDIAMKSLYNEGDKVELKLVEDILRPNKIEFSSEQSLESYWDILTNSGFIKPSIGFGNSGKISLSKTGFDIMSNYGSYMEFLKAKNNIPSPNPSINLTIQPPTISEEE
jgi:hypothetical protein